MILYHGSNVAIDRIDLSRSRPGKDFGRGFYFGSTIQYIEESMSTFQYLKEGLISDLVLKVMEDYGLEMEKALDVVFLSETYRKLSDPKTGLYFQGPVYVYSFLKEELSIGKIA